MERQSDHKATAGKSAVTSAAGGFGPTALARLEPPRTSACLYPACATPAHGSEPVASCCRFASQRGGNPLPCPASALAPLLAGVAGSQCASSNRWSRHDQALWHPSIFCGFARVGDGLTPSLSATKFFLLGPLRGSERPLLAFFPDFSSPLPFWLPIPLLLLSLTRSTSCSHQLSLFRFR